MFFWTSTCSQPFFQRHWVNSQFHLQLFIRLIILIIFYYKNAVASTHSFMIVCYLTTSITINFYYGLVFISREHLKRFIMSRSLSLFHNTYCSHSWGHSTITLSQNAQNTRTTPPHPLFALVQFWQPPHPPSNILNLTSTHPHHHHNHYHLCPHILEAKFAEDSLSNFWRFKKIQGTSTTWTKKLNGATHND